MEMDWEEDWGDMEYIEHMTLELMMKDLDILKEDMEVDKGGESNVHCDDYGEFDDELEHSFLDNILEKMDMDREPHCEEVEMVVDMMESALVLEPQIVYDDCQVVPGDMDSYERGVQGNCGGDMNTRQSQTKIIDVNTEAYTSEGTWYQNNWVQNNKTQGEEKARVPECKNKLGCACATSELGNMDDQFTRIGTVCCPGRGTRGAGRNKLNGGEELRQKEPGDG